MCISSSNALSNAFVYPVEHGVLLCRRIEEVASQKDEKGNIQFDPDALMEALRGIIMTEDASA